MEKKNNTTAAPLFCSFDIYRGKEGFKESRRPIHRPGHEGILHEMLTQDGISLGYYNVESSEEGQVVINNQRSFIQCSFSISGNKQYSVDGGKKRVASFTNHEYNYLFFNEQEIYLNWQPGERLETFELGLSPELFLNYLPETHPYYSAYEKSVSNNTPTPMSKVNMPLTESFSNILYTMLRCPLEGRYKELFVKSKTLELLAFQLEQYEQITGMSTVAEQHKGLKKSDIEKMHHAHSIIMQNLDSPCSLIDLAHQVGTNEAYLKRHFKEVYGNTVFGYLQQVKMDKARELLADGKTVGEVASYVGYKYPVHFARAFKKHFGYPPNKVKK
jgi:AraC-like DNA-binding protein